MVLHALNLQKLRWRWAHVIEREGDSTSQAVRQGLVPSEINSQIVVFIQQSNNQLIYDSSSLTHLTRG